MMMLKQVILLDKIFIACLIVSLSLGMAQVYAQEDTSAIKQPSKPKIIFKDQPPPIVIPSSQNAMDSSRPRIVFQDNTALEKDKIELTSSDYYRFRGQTYPVGDGGSNLKVALQSNPQAVEMVESAYRKRTTGTILMGVGGALIVSGYVVSSTQVKLAEDRSGGTTVTWYWLPLVTLGTVVGGIGYVNHTSLESNLHEAVQLYNDSLSVYPRDTLKTP